MPFDLLICDLDGTLVDSKHDLMAALNHALGHLGQPLVDVEDVPGLLGSGLLSLLKSVTSTDDPELLDHARHLFDAYYREHVADLTRCYPGVPETLAALPGIKKAVYSNKPHAFTEAVVEAVGLAPFFNIILGAQPEIMPLKPDPAGIRHLLSALQIAPERALMVGDSTHDLEAARAAGVPACAVTYGYRPAEALRAHQPEFVINGFGELMGIFGKKAE